MKAMVNGFLKEVPLSAMMLTGRKRALVIAAKAVFQQAIMKYASDVEEPTFENCRRPLALMMMRVRDKFFERNEPPRKEMIEAAFKIMIEEIEHNAEYYPYWKDLIELIKEM